ncbi:hypothetical protein D9M68_687620 [compost metagenome]
MVGNDTDDIHGKSARTPLGQQHVQAMVVLGNGQQHLRAMLRRTQPETHLQLLAQLREQLLQAADRNLQEVGLEHHASKEHLGVRITVVGRLGDVGALLEKKIGDFGQNPQAVRALERKDVASAGFLSRCSHGRAS